MFSAEAVHEEKPAPVPAAPRDVLPEESEGNTTPRVTLEQL